MAPTDALHPVNISTPRSFPTKLRSHIKETFFADDPFGQLKTKTPLGRAKKIVEYFLPIFEWLPRYNLRLFGYDLLAGITITSLAIPQGISYAKLANVPAVIGLYSSFVPALIYPLFGSSKHIAIGTIAASSLLLADTIGQKDDPTLYLNLVFTATFITGIFQATLGFLRLGIVVDFLSHSTITGFMGGAAVIVCLQQLKGIFGLKNFTTKTDVVNVLQTVFVNRKEWRWESALVGICFLIFLLITRYVSIRKPKLFWVSAISPMVVVVIGCTFAYFAHAEDHGIQIVGELKKGLNPISIMNLNFDSKYLPKVVQVALVTGILATTEGIAIGRSFAIMKNDQIDGNKEMVAFGIMNIIGSFTSCYLTTGPFSKSAVNYNAGCKTAMSNIVMALCMMLTLLFLAPIFSYTPIVALSAIIMTAMLGLIKYEAAYHLYKVDKFDFIICMSAFLGVSFLTMDMGLMISVGISVIRALWYVARPATCKLGNMENTSLYRDIEQYPNANRIPGILIIQLGSPIYFASCTYIRERIMRWVRDEQAKSESDGGIVERILLDLGGVTSIDTNGIETLIEVRRTLEAKGIQMDIVNPRVDVTDKMVHSEFIELIGKESIFLSIDDAIEAYRKSKNVEDNCFS